MKNHIRKIFSEPEYYFNDKFKGHTIIIGKKNSKNIISKRFSHRKSIIRIKTLNPIWNDAPTLVIIVYK